MNIPVLLLYAITRIMFTWKTVLATSKSKHFHLLTTISYLLACTCWHLFSLLWAVYTANSHNAPQNCSAELHNMCLKSALTLYNACHMGEGIQVNLHYFVDNKCFFSKYKYKQIYRYYYMESRTRTVVQVHCPLCFTLAVSQQLSSRCMCVVGVCVSYVSVSCVGNWLDVCWVARLASFIAGVFLINLLYSKAKTRLNT